MKGAVPGKASALRESRMRPNRPARQYRRKALQRRCQRHSCRQPARSTPANFRRMGKSPYRIRYGHQRDFHETTLNIPNSQARGEAVLCRWRFPEVEETVLSRTAAVRGPWGLTRARARLRHSQRRGRAVPFSEKQASRSRQRYGRPFGCTVDSRRPVTSGSHLGAPRERMTPSAATAAKRDGAAAVSGETSGPVRPTVVVAEATLVI